VPAVLLRDFVLLDRQPWPQGGAGCIRPQWAGYHHLFLHHKIWDESRVELPPTRQTMANSVISARRRWPSPLCALIKSFTCCGFRPLIPSAEPAGKDLIDFKMADSCRTRHDDALNGVGGKLSGDAARCGCLRRRAATVSSLCGAMVLSLAAKRMAPDISLLISPTLELIGFI